ncbi:hypothetical protein C8R45DRAFT_929401 [Mycena sanguinolenta]|nr:hypothetical protein C8R45DRAFT_929401 [Mycena sanguinolenta]
MVKYVDFSSDASIRQGSQLPVPLYYPFGLQLYVGSRCTACGISFSQYQRSAADAIGSVASVQGRNADTRLFFQNGDKSISEVVVSGPFNSGSFGSSTLLVLGNEILSGTLIAAATVNGTAVEKVNMLALDTYGLIADGLPPRSMFSFCSSSQHPERVHLDQ